MNGLGTVRAVEVAHSIHGDSSTENASTGSGGGGGGSSVNASPDFDVNALLENMPKPRALGKGKKGAASARRGGVGTAGGGGAVGSSGAVAVGLNVDAWVQFTSFRGFERALKALRGRVLQKAGAELICEYKLGVDVTGYMTQDQRRKREIRRSQEAHEVGYYSSTYFISLGPRMHLCLYRYIFLHAWLNAGEGATLSTPDFTIPFSRSVRNSC